ncbi:cysteine desulfurase [Myxococcota bacterium]|nr:cysteine desulfurase [Myxococcota bacterium]
MIYLDYNATTPLDRRVADAMLPFLFEHFGNPSSSHRFGQVTRAAIDSAREEVARLIGASTDEIIFTSGGTESNNMAIKGIAERDVQKGRHIVISAFEHPAITEPCAYLEKKGFRITRIPVDKTGMIDLEALEKALTSETILVSVMLANNEVGTLQPLEAISALTRPRGITLHSDAAQAIGKMPVDIQALGVDLLTIAGHKFYAPKGIGALYLRRGVALPVWMHGASHEQGRRAGTENILEIVGMGEAARLARIEMNEEITRLQTLRDLLWQNLQTALPDRVFLHGHPTARLCNTLNVGFSDLRGLDLAQDLQDQVACSLGSACHSNAHGMSSVLQVMGISPQTGMGALRLSLGRMTQREEIEKAANALVYAAKQRYRTL